MKNAAYDGPAQMQIVCPFFKRESRMNHDIICEGPLPNVTNALRFGAESTRQEWMQAYCMDLSACEKCLIYHVANYKY